MPLRLTRTISILMSRRSYMNHIQRWWRWWMTGYSTLEQHAHSILPKWSIISQQLIVCLLGWPVSQGVHLNIIHARGIWTSHRTDITVMTDPTIVYVLRCFVSTPAMHLMDPDKNQSSNSKYVSPFQHPAETQENYIAIPCVLNKPVLNIQERLDETGLKRLSDITPI